MSNKFVETINYLKELRENIENFSDEERPEKLLLAIIKNAILSDNLNRGSILFTKDEFGYKVSNIQKRSYAWLLKGEYIDVDFVMQELQKLGITYQLVPYPIGENKNDLELSFEIELSKPIKKTRKNSEISF